MRNAPLSVLLFLALLATGCVGPNLQRVAADRATHDWFAPLTRSYILADTALDEAAKATHLRGLQAWDERIQADEAAAGLAFPPAPGVGQ